MHFFTPHLAVAALLCNQVQICFSEVQTYCQWQIFNPKCASDEVIVMKSAMYGRFKPCIERDYGYLGCQSDVLTLADTLCSGRRECELKIPVEKFGVNSTCPRDLSRHLLAEYSCVKVITPNRTYCYSHKTALLPPTGGWLAYKTTEETGCGSTETPWVIKTDPGQTINFTLHDFALKSALYNDSARFMAASSHCQVYAIFKESVSGRSKTICGGNTRVSQAYTTSANEVEIRVMVGNAKRYFALEYDVQGCPDPLQPIGGWMERRGDDVILGCDKDDVTWSMTCKGNQWNGTRIKNCSKGTVSTGELAFAGIPFSHTLSIVVILAVAMVIGVLILAVGLICLKRRRQHPPQPPPFGTFNPTGYKDDMNYKTSTTCTAYSQPSFMTRTDTSGENDYEYVDDIKFPPPPPHIAGSTFGKTVAGSGCAAHGAGAPNQYGFDGTPNFAQLKAAQPGVVHVQQLPVSGPIVPQYYELDPGRETERKEAGVPRAVSEENPDKSSQQNMNFGHYSQ